MNNFEISKNCRLKTQRPYPMKEKFVTRILSNMMENYSSNNIPDYLAGKSLFEEPNLELEFDQNVKNVPVY
jgi:hypothetical protein